MVEFSQTPINKSELAIGMIDHDVVRLNIAMHDALRVAKVKSFKNLKHIVPNVKVIEALIELAEVSITRVNKLSDNGRGLRQGVSHHINQVNDVYTTFKCLQNLNLTSDLVLLDRLEDFDNDSLIGLRVNALVDL